MDERAARLAGLQLRKYCPVFPRRHDWRCILDWVGLSNLAAILGERTGRWRMAPEAAAAGHVRLSVTGPRRWEATMLRSRVTELHFITPVANLGSIVTYGILSHNLAERLPHTSVALERIQDRRAGNESHEADRYTTTRTYTLMPVIR